MEETSKKQPKKEAESQPKKAKKKPSKSARNYVINGKKFHYLQELTPEEVKLFKAKKCEFIT